MKRIILALMIIAVTSISAATALAQRPPGDQGSPPQGQPEKPRMPEDPLGDAMFPPEMIMQHQRELALTDEQKTFMRGEIQRTTTRFNELQWQLQDAMESLHETMKSNSVNEPLALSQLDKVLDSEREIKRLHMELAIRIKNKLTPDQIHERHEAKLPDDCPHCHGTLVETGTAEQFQTEIPRTPIHRQFTVHLGRCSCCGKS